MLLFLKFILQNLNIQHLSIKIQNLLLFIHDIIMLNHANFSTLK